MMRLELVVCALATLALAAARAPAANLVQKFDDKSRDVSYVSIQSRSSEASGDESNQVVFAPDAEPPVNQRFPSAVLFGRTCGGTILSDRWVLSAGHCTLFTGGRDVLAGTNNSGDGSGVRRRVKKLHLHPLFTVGPYWLDARRFNISQVAARWDFLLAELEEPLPLNDKTIKPVRLDVTDELPAGLRVGYAGYGAEHHGETMRHDMHGMELEILSDAECSSLKQFDTDDMLCARGTPPRRDSACNGDSGSGLVDEQNRLVGVASWVEEDSLRCFNGAKVVFAKVSAVKSWIEEVTGIPLNSKSTST